MNSGPKGNVKEETDRKGLYTQHYGTVRPGSELKVPHFKEREDRRETRQRGPREWVGQDDERVRTMRGVQEDGRVQDDERGKRGGSQKIRSTGDLKWTLSGFFSPECGFSAQRLSNRSGWEEDRRELYISDRDGQDGRRTGGCCTSAYRDGQDGKKNGRRT